eukprot:COSAG02_NODE_73_length_41919_cov_6.571066_9_plen_193_part_00
MANATADLAAALAAQTEDVAKATNVMWVLLCTCLVFWEQAGFAMWEAGSLPTRSLHSILLKNMCDAAIGAAAFFSCGYAFAFGGDGNAFVGTSYFFLVNLDEDEYYMWFFQWAFAATAATTVSGCMAERTCFCGYLIYAFCITSVIYAIVVHWVWVRSPAPTSHISLRPVLPLRCLRRACEPDGRRLAVRLE